MINNIITENNNFRIRQYLNAGETTFLRINGYDWYYYGSPVDPGQAASVLNVQIPSTSLPEAEEGATFNVIIVYETTPDTGNAGNAQQAFAEAQNVQSSQTGGQ